MRRKLAEYLQRTWYASRRPPVLLRMLSRIHGAWLGGRLDRPAARPPCPVIVVGNLTAGGSGKTPVVVQLVRVLAGAGFNPAIVSRGYGGVEPREPVRVAPGDDPDRAGDEAVMLAGATDAPVWVCRDRKQALEAAVEQGAGVVVSDDGLQHVALPRSFEICVVDGSLRFGNGELLPAGPLRQPLDRLGEVDVVLTKCSSPDDRVGPDEQVFWLHAERLRAVDGGATRPPESLAPGPVDAVAGIGYPEGFFQLLERLGYAVRRHPRPDHHRFRREEIAELSGPVVVTAKDAVKLAGLTDRADLWVLDVTARLPEDLVGRMLSHVREFRTS